MRGQRQKIWLVGLPFVVAIGLWAVVTELGFIPLFFLPTPLAVASAFIDLMGNGFGLDITISILRVAVGFLMAVIVALPLGIALGRKQSLELILRPMIDLIRYTPISAVIPLLILWFGINEMEKIVVIFLSVVFQLILMVATAVAETPRELIDSARTLGAQERQVVARIILPGMMPRFFDDLRISMGWAWSSLLIAEVVGSRSGIGFVIIQSQRLLQTEAVIAAIIVVGVIGLVTDATFRLVARRRFVWAATTRQGARYA